MDDEANRQELPDETVMPASPHSDMSGLLSEENLAQIDVNNLLCPLTPERAAEIEQAVSARLVDRIGRQRVCVVCDCLTPPSDVTVIPLEEINYALWKKLLTYEGDRTEEEEEKTPPSDELFNQYSLQAVDRRLIGLMLSPRGVSRDNEGNITGLTICSTCHKELGKEELPEHAIANGNYMGVMPTKLREVPQIYHDLTNLAIPAGFIKNVNYSTASQLRSHCYMVNRFNI